MKSPQNLLLASGLALLLPFLTATAVHAQSVVVPGGNAGTEGNQNNLIPFSFNNNRYQQVYGASAFAGVPAGGAYLTQIAFRPDAEFGAAFASILPSVRIDLAVTMAAVDGLSTTFASNLTSGSTIVYGGVSGAALALSSAFTGPAGGPKAFDIIITFTTPFFYDPALGNLLLDVRNFGGGTTTLFDAQSMLNDSISRVGTFGGGVGSATGNFADSLGLVTKFTYAPAAAPENAESALLLGLGAGALFWLRRRVAA